MKIRHWIMLLRALIILALIAGLVKYDLDLGNDGYLKENLSALGVHLPEQKVQKKPQAQVPLEPILRINVNVAHSVYINYAGYFTSYSQEEMKKHRVTPYGDGIMYVEWPPKTPIENPEDAIAKVCDRGIYPPDRLEAFEWLKENAPDSCEKVATYYNQLSKEEVQEIHMMTHVGCGYVARPSGMDIGQAELDLRRRSTIYLKNRNLDFQEEDEPRIDFDSFYSPDFIDRIPRMLHVVGGIIYIYNGLSSGKKPLTLQDLCKIWKAGKDIGYFDSRGYASMVAALLNKEDTGLFDEIINAVKMHKTNPTRESQDDINVYKELLIDFPDKHCLPYDDAMNIIKYTNKSKEWNHHRKEYYMFLHRAFCDDKGSKKESYSTILDIVIRRFYDLIIRTHFPVGLQNYNRFYNTVLDLPDWHCIPYDVMLQLADMVPDPAFKQGLLVRRESYQKNYDRFCSDETKANEIRTRWSLDYRNYPW